jgi:hypothetical protein
LLIPAYDCEVVTGDGEAVDADAPDPDELGAGDDDEPVEVDVALGCVVVVLDPVELVVDEELDDLCADGDAGAPLRSTTATDLAWL